MNWEKFGYVASSKYRRNIVLSLVNNHKMPKELAEYTGMYISHVSSTLTELNKKNIVKCINPEMRKGKIYILTEVGKEILTELKKRRYKIG